MFKRNLTAVFQYLQARKVFQYSSTYRPVLTKRTHSLHKEPQKKGNRKKLHWEKFDKDESKMIFLS